MGENPLGPLTVVPRWQHPGTRKVLVLLAPVFSLGSQKKSKSTQSLPIGRIGNPLYGSS